jgi:TolB-like protein/DNA-binding winged helix-turn-helix (wHTH) protein
MPTSQSIAAQKARPPGEGFPKKMLWMPSAASIGPASGAALTVGAWRVDTAGNQLIRDGEAVRLEPKAIEVLVQLAHRRGQVVGRAELLGAVWPGVVVGDDALTQAIIKLRKALGDDARRPRYIETISKRGYRLVAPVASAGDAPPTAGETAHKGPARRPWAMPALLAAVAVLLVAVLLLWFMRGKGVPVAAERPTIAVLPLVSQGSDPQRGYFADGVTEDIIFALGRFSGLGVIAHSAVERYKQRPADMHAIKRELGARYLVTGSLHETDGRMRLSVELSDADRGLVLWSQRYEGPPSELYAFQERIAKSIVGTLAVKVTQAEEQRAAAKPPDSLDAYDLTLRARALVVRSDRAANRQARELLARAVQLAPDYAEAYVVLAAAESQRSVSYGWTEDPAASIQRAEQYARRALTIDDPGAHARAHSQLAILYANSRNLDQALAEADLAIELNPSDALAFDARGSALLWLGRAEEAITALDTALKYNPVGRGSGGAFDRALAYYTARRYREALAIAESALARYPDAAFLHAMRAATLGQLGDTQDARAAAAQAARLDPFFRWADFGNRFAKPQDTAHLQEGVRKAGM